jgi:hypothetical protein
MCANNTRYFSFNPRKFSLRYFSICFACKGNVRAQMSQVQFQASPYGICGRQTDTGSSLSPRVLQFSRIHHSVNASVSFVTAPEVWDRAWQCPYHILGPLVMSSEWGPLILSAMYFPIQHFDTRLFSHRVSQHLIYVFCKFLIINND